MKCDEKKLEKWFEKVATILWGSAIATVNAERLLEYPNPEMKKYERQVKSTGFFQQHWYQCKYIQVIELCKL